LFRSKKSASLAYYTVFSIGPLILILIWALGFFYGSQLDSPTGARDEIMEELNQLFGKDIALMLDAAIKRISFESKNSIGVYVGVGALVFLLQQSLSIYRTPSMRSGG